MENNNQVLPPKKLLPAIDLFKKAFDIYQKKAWLLFKIVAFGLLGCLVLLPLTLIAFVISYAPFRNRHFSPTLMLVDALLLLIGLLFCIMFSLWARVASFYAIKEDNMDVKKALSKAWGNMGPFFWVSFLMGLAIFAGFLLFIVPGIIFAVWFAFSLYIFVFEGARGTEALKKSKELVKGNWWPVFGRIIVMISITILISWIRFLGSVINILFTYPFFMVYMVVLYEDLKRVGG